MKRDEMKGETKKGETDLFRFGSEVLGRLDRIITLLEAQARTPARMSSEDAKKRNAKKGQVSDKTFRTIGVGLVKLISDSNGIGKLVVSLAEAFDCSTSTIIRVAKRLDRETEFIQILPSAGNHGMTIRVTNPEQARVWVGAMEADRGPEPIPR